MTIVCFCVLIATQAVWAANDLPVIGDSSSSSISLDEERKLGNAWLRVLRGRTKQLHDPFVYEYTEDLLYQLATYSNLADKRLTLVLLNNPTLNAFAVPGGIIGIHAGLYRYAKTEGQFASVLAHEVSHLSQRHYANGLEEQRKSLPLQLATIFGAILVAANSNGNATAAAVASGQAAMIDQQLAFSRQNEREADDIGMQLLVNAGFKPDAMPAMFSQMQRSARFQGSQIPEFLRTHPVTQSRIAETENRAAQLSQNGKDDSLRYQLVRDRVLILLHDNPKDLIAQYPDLPNPKAADHYLYVLACIAAGQPERAEQALKTLQQDHSEQLLIKALDIQWQLARGQSQQAKVQAKQLLSLYPGNYPLSMLYIDTLKASKDYTVIEGILEEQLRQRPDNDQLWFELAENSGQLGLILKVHKARAEYYLLHGNIKMAESHLKQALRTPGLNDQEKAILESRLEDSKAIRDSLDF